MKIMECRYVDEDQENHQWTGRIKQIEEFDHYLLIQVEGKGSAMDVLVGRAGTYNWICLPGMEVASQLSDWNDTYWNLEKLSRLMSPCDAITITNMLATLAKK